MLSAHPPIYIVLASRNGSRYLPEQLGSLIEQSYQNWHLILSDDRSHDDTVGIVQRHIPSEQLTILRGPEQGAAQNFWNGVLRAPSDGYLAFCDQDDVWHRDKLERAILRLGDCRGAGFYTAGRMITDSDLNPVAFDPRYSPGPLRRALFRNRAAGNTMVFNTAALLHLKAWPPPLGIPFHDWWAALVLLAAGAQVFHDPHAVLKYRHHAGNLFGARGGRLKLIADGTYQTWVSANCAALDAIGPSMTPEARKDLNNAQRALSRGAISVLAQIVLASAPIARTR